MKILRRIAAIAILAGLASVGRGADKPVLVLESPQLIKAEWESALLDLADLNGDGRMDAVAVDNSKSLLEVFVQKKSGGDLKFEKREEVLEFPVLSLVAADLNQDGRADLAMASPDRDILIRYQTKDGTLAPPTPLDAQGVMLRALDLDGDKTMDLMVMHQERTVIFYGDKEKGVAAGERVEFYHAGIPGGRPALADFDGNGLTDVAFIDSQKRSRALVRFQRSARQWGLQIPYGVSDTAEITGVSRLSKGRALLAAVDARTHELRVYRLESAPAADAGVEMLLDGPYYLTVDPQSHSDREVLLPADINGDGRQDILLATPKAPEISLFIQDKEGRLTAKRAPSLFDVQSVVAVSRKSGALVFALSGREQTIGASKWDSARGLTVPEMLDFVGQPRAMAVADIDGSGSEDVLFLFSSEGKTTQLAVIENPASPDAVRQAPRIVKLPDAVGKEEIEGLLAGDVNGDGRADLLAFRRYSSLLILLQKDDGLFELYPTSEGMKKSIFSRLAPGELILADLDGKAPVEMLIARDSLARAYRISPEGRLDMVEQFNARNASSRIVGLTTANLDGKGPDEVVLLDAGNNLLSIFHRGEDGVHKIVRHHEVEDMQGTRLGAADVNGDGRDDLLLYQNARSQVFYSGAAPARMNAIWRHATDIKDGQYSRLEPVRLLAGKAARDSEQLLALEDSENALEFFRATEGDGAPLEQFFQFKVFDDENSVGPRRKRRARIEPRTMTVADVNDDGAPDLVLLMHDNIAVYLQKD